MGVTSPPPMVVDAASKAQLREAFKEDYHEAIRANVARLLGNYVTLLNTTDDAETLRKGLEFMGRTVGLEAEKRLDTGPALQVIHFNIRGISSTPIVNTQLATVIEDVRDKLQAMDLPSAPIEMPELNAVPSALMRANQYINDEAMDDAA